MQDQKFEVWAIVELFGHQKMAGHVSEQTIGGQTMVRIETPDTGEIPAFTRLLNVSAIYAINPVTEEVARGYAKRIQAQPINVWDAREVLKRIDAAKQIASADDSQEEEKEEEKENDDENFSIQE